MRKDLLIVAVLVCSVILLFSGTKIQSVEEYYLANIDEITPESEVVSLEIRADTAVENIHRIKNGLHPYIPKDGTILANQQYVLRHGDTVFSILNRATRHHRIQMEYQGAKANAYNTVYIQGIQYLYEFSCGPLSGWMYEVNGEFPNYGVSQYKLQDGDQIVFQYTCDLGRDLGHEFRE